MTIEQAENIWRRVLGTSGRKFTDEIQKRLERKMKLANQFCLQFVEFEDVETS